MWKNHKPAVTEFHDVLVMQRRYAHLHLIVVRGTPLDILHKILWCLQARGRVSLGRSNNLTEARPRKRRHPTAKQMTAHCVIAGVCSP